MKYVIDRFEGNKAVCEIYDNKLKEKVIFDIKQLYKNPKEGDHFYILNGEYVLDIESTNKARQKNIDLLKSLYE